MDLFTSILQIAKKGGGDLIGIIKMTAGNISDKAEVNREIETIISSKKYEQMIMNFIPVFIIAYVDFASPGLLSQLYGNLFGVIVMSVCLVIYITAFLLSVKITGIEV